MQYILYGEYGRLGNGHSLLPQKCAFHVPVFVSIRWDSIELVYPLSLGRQMSSLSPVAITAADKYIAIYSSLSIKIQTSHRIFTRHIFDKTKNLNPN